MLLIQDFPPEDMHCQKINTSLVLSIQNPIRNRANCGCSESPKHSSSVFSFNLFVYSVYLPYRNFWWLVHDYNMLLNVKGHVKVAVMRALLTAFSLKNLLPSLRPWLPCLQVSLIF